MWPSIVEKDERGTERVYDLVSRLLKDRIILVSEEINSSSASSIIAQLLYLEADDSKAPITIYINSPGGSIADGLAIYDIINNIKCRNGSFYGSFPALQWDKRDALLPS